MIEPDEVLVRYTCPNDGRRFFDRVKLGQWIAMDTPQHCANTTADLQVLLANIDEKVTR